MKNKTCGECIYFDNGYCDFLDFEPKPEMGGCANFTHRPTNGDLIRQGGNRELAECCVYEVGNMFASTLIEDKTFETYEDAVDSTESWLNAPAKEESEGNNG